MGPDAVATSEPGGARDVVLRVVRVSKTFPGTVALKDVSLELQRGEVHALVGTNGSGKSTLIKVLAGVCAADPGGEIEIGRRRFSASRFGPADAREGGLHFVHQAPAIFPMLSVAENLAIGRGFEMRPGGRIAWAEQRERAKRVIARFHIRAEPDIPVGFLRPADRTLVAIARALQDQEGEHEGVLVLDEPTASLPGPEVERLLEALRRYAAAGQTIVYVTHRLEEVLRVSDRVTALRDGRVVDTVATRSIDELGLVSLIVGRAVDAPAPVSRSGAPSVGAALLVARNVAGGPVASASFEVARGEILGIAGLLGCGASEVLRMLFGDAPISSGELTLDAKPYRPQSARAAMDAGLAYVPADRAADAAFHGMSVRANLSAAGVRRYFRGMRLRHAVEKGEAGAAIRRFLIRAASDEQVLSTLSGGNQQKVVLARWLRDTPKLILLDEPTQGVDVHARAEIHDALRKAAAEGTASVVVTSDFRELAHLCDRVLVMVQGRIVGEVRPPALDAHRLTELAHFTPETAP
ncbi:MAG TPA: sugar ABC transporter ATP-binding protein [Polyangiaceae bacterium]|nr:sugar ABC transporter ATP-binding protein [Polyangiaceae bacterium]